MKNAIINLKNVLFVKKEKIKSNDFNKDFKFSKLKKN